MITADRGFIQFLGPDFGFCLLGSSDRGSQRSRGNLSLPSFMCRMSRSGENDFGCLNILLIVILTEHLFRYRA